MVEGYRKVLLETGFRFLGESKEAPLQCPHSDLKKQIRVVEKGLMWFLKGGVGNHTHLDGGAMPVQAV